jgi:hypothetical protein
MNRHYIPGTLFLVSLIGFGIVSGQQTASLDTKIVVGQYRVIPFPELFIDDEEAQQRLREVMFHVKKGDESQGIHRTDMLPKDYERAINGMAADGWQLVTVNKSNYWVFQKQ